MASVLEVTMRDGNGVPQPSSRIAKYTVLEVTMRDGNFKTYSMLKWFSIGFRSDYEGWKLFTVLKLLSFVILNSF